MDAVAAFLVILALAAILLVVFRAARRARVGRSRSTDFEIVGWNGRPAESVNAPLKDKASADFAGALRWQNPDAVCLLTGARAADCGCETHRSLA
jgi:hypothetical protein